MSRYVDDRQLDFAWQPSFNTSIPKTFKGRIGKEHFIQFELTSIPWFNPADYRVVVESLSSSSTFRDIGSLTHLVMLPDIYLGKRVGLVPKSRKLPTFWSNELVRGGTYVIRNEKPVDGIIKLHKIGGMR